MKLLECSGPIDKKAYKVVKKARLEDVWTPKPKTASHIIRSENVLRTRPLPKSAKHMDVVIGKKRGRMTVVGYSEKQPSGDKPAAWVARCDCGNFEHRTKILRWLGTDAQDMCTECRNREFLTKGSSFDREKANRSESFVELVKNL